MKNQIFKSVIILFLLFLILSSAMAQKEWTFMVYLDGDNNLEEAAIDDFLEMAQVGSTSNVNIVVMMDRYSGAGEYDNWTNTLGFYITNGMTPTTNNAVINFGELNMGDTNSIQIFIKWAVTNYHADKYALILWNHGDGWRARDKKDHRANTRTVCSDDTSNDKLYMDEVRTAISNSIESLSITNIDLIGFDACLMGMVEVAYQLRGLCTIMVGSEEVEPLDGWPYDTILSDLITNSTSTPEKLGSYIVYRYGECYDGFGFETQSAFLMSELTNLCKQIDLFQSKMNWTSYEPHWKEVENAQTSLYYYALWGTYYIDLWDFADKIYNNVTDTQVQTEAIQLKQKLNDFAYTNYHNLFANSSHGVSIYFPPTSSDYNNDIDFPGYEETNTVFPVDFVIHHQWDNFIKRYHQRTNNNTPPELINPSAEATAVDGLNVKGKSSDIFIFKCTYKDLDNDKPGFIPLGITNSIFLAVMTNGIDYGLIEIKTNGGSLNYAVGYEFTLTTTGSQSNVFLTQSGTVTNSFTYLSLLYSTNLRYQFRARPVTGMTQETGWSLNPDSSNWNDFPRIIVDDTPPALPVFYTNIVDSYYGNAIDSTWTKSISDDLLCYNIIYCTNTNNGTIWTNNAGTYTNILTTGLQSSCLYYLKLSLSDDVFNISSTAWKTNRTSNALPLLTQATASAPVVNGLNVKGRSSDTFTFKVTYSDMEGNKPGDVSYGVTNCIFINVYTNNDFYGTIVIMTNQPLPSSGYTNGYQFSFSTTGKQSNIFYPLTGSGITNSFANLSAIYKENLKYQFGAKAVNGNTNYTCNPFTNINGLPNILVDDDPPAISTITVDEITSDSAKILWIKSSSDDIAWYELLWGITTDCKNSSGTLSSVTISYNLTELDPETTYYYKLKICDDVNNTSEVSGEFTTKKGEIPKAYAYPTVAEKGQTVKFNYTDESSEIKIYNVFGRLITTIGASEKKEWAPCSSIACGFYIAVYKDKSGKIAKSKFIYGIKR